MPQLTLRLSRNWGGRRTGAGRPKLPRRRAVAHRARPEHKMRFPVHVTLRAKGGLPSFRGDRVYAGLRPALAAASSRRHFRIIHFSVQSDHIHLLVEAHDSSALSSGCRGLAIRTARAVNRVLGRKGPIWGDRYHTRALMSPREVRNGLVYVLMNIKKHFQGWRGVDPKSSANWFDGFRGATAPAGADPPPVQAARSWLAAHGWRRHGLISIHECPKLPG